MFGLGGTFVSFIILGNYSLGLQVFGKLDVMGLYAASGDLYSTITAIIRTLPLAPMVLVLLAAAMIAFYATSFDAIVLVASAYSYKNLTSEDEPHMAIKTFWSLSLILLPMVLIFSDNSMANLQTVSHHCSISDRVYHSPDRGGVFLKMRRNIFQAAMVLNELID